MWGARSLGALRPFTLTVVCLVVFGQDVLCEKERHVEQLMREREMQQAEMTRIIENTGHIQHTLARLQKEYDEYRNDCEDKFRDHLSLLSKLKKEKGQLADQLDDEKKKLEDIQFRFEEEIVSKDDIEESRKSEQSRMKQLEDSLSFERHKNDKLQKEAKKYLDAQERLLKAEQQLEDLKIETVSRAKRSTAIDEKMVDYQEELRQLKKTVLDKDAEIAEKLKRIEELESENKNLEAEKESLANRRQNDLNAFNKYKTEQNELATNLTETAHRHEAELSTKTAECDIKTARIKELETEITNSQEKVKSAQELVASKCIEFSTQERVKAEKQLSELKKQVAETSSSLINAQKDNRVQTAEKDMQIKKLEINLKSATFEASRLQSQVDEVFANCHKLKAGLVNRHKRNAEISHAEMTALQQDLHLKAQELGVCQDLNAHLENEICGKNAHIEQYKTSIESFDRIIAEQRSYIEQLTLQLNSQSGSSEQIQEAARTIAQLETMVAELRTKLSAALLVPEEYERHSALLQLELQQLEETMTRVKIELSNNLKQAQSTQRQLQAELAHTRQHHKIQLDELTQQLQIALSREQTANSKWQSRLGETTRLQDDLRAQIATLQQNLEAHRQTSLLDVEESETTIMELRQQLTAALTHQQELSRSFETQIVQLNADITNLNVQIEEKSALLLQAHNRFTETIEEMSSTIVTHEHSIQELQDMNGALNTQMLEANRADSDQLAEAQSVIARLTNDMAALQRDKQELQVLAETVNTQSETLQSELSLMLSEKQVLAEQMTEKESTIAQMNSDVATLREQVKITDQVLMERESKIVTLMDQMRRFQEERGSNSDLFLSQEKQLIDLNIAIQRLQQEKQELTLVISEKESRYDEYVRQCAGQFQALDVQLREKEKVYQRLQSDIETLNIEKEKIVQNMHDKEDLIIRLNEQVVIFRSEKEVIEKTLEETKHFVQVIQRDLQASNNCEETAKVIIQGLRDTVEENERSIVTLNQNLDHYKQEWEQPTGNPYVQDLIREIQDKERLIADKELLVINLNDDIKRVSEQTIQVENMWRSSEYKWKQQLEETDRMRQTTITQCNGLQDQIVALNRQLETSQHLELKLEEEKRKYAHIYNEFQLLEQQRENILKNLRAFTQAQTECQPVIQIVDDLQNNVSESTIKEFDEKVNADRIGLERALDDTKTLLMEKERQLLQQQYEFEQMKSQIADIKTKVVEVVVPVPGPVQFVGCASNTQQTDTNMDLQAQNTDMHTALNHPGNTGFTQNALRSTLSDHSALRQDSMLDVGHVDHPRLPGNAMFNLNNNEQLAVDDVRSLGLGAGDAGACDMQAYLALVKENEVTKGQIEFLNNIIVDMHRKNEELKYKVEVLESSSSSTSVSQGSKLSFTGNIILRRPRIYCDICEIFDAHETEDCPVQGGEEDHHALGGIRGHSEPRMYCDLCEVFGHDTSDCDNQTF